MKIVKSFAGLFLVIIWGCSSTVKLPYELLDFKYYEIPRDLLEQSLNEKTINFFSKYLKGRKIMLDPGHGGEDKKNSSMYRKVIEAEINLKVALELRDFLESAGAVVYMTREDDETLDLAERSKIANLSDAEIFISIHHNAAGEGNYWANYTSTFYHAREENYEYEPFNHMMARYVQRDLAYVMRNSGGLGSFDGTYSDFKMYPNSGFSVLRKTEIPAILIECAFHTNRFEEARLDDDEFNRIQAWGIFRGIGKFFTQGFPEIEFLYDHSSYNNTQLDLFFKISSSREIDEHSIRTYFDSTQVNYEFNKENMVVKTTIQNVDKGLHEFKIVAANKKGNYAFPLKIKILTK